jgi:hypothetical protein
MTRLLAAVVMFATVAHAAPPAGRSGGKPVEQVSWGGKVASGPDTSQMSGNAKLRVSGDVDGQAEFHIVVGADTTTVHAIVDCLSISGTQAWLSGTITHSNNPKLEGQSITWTVVDGGEPSEGVDFGAFSIFSQRIDCTIHPALTLLPWVEGNVQIHGARFHGQRDPEALPAPTTRARWGDVKRSYR